MIEQETVFNPGETVVFSTGDYSSYSVEAIYRILKRVDLAEVLETIRPECKRCGPNPTYFFGENYPKLYAALEAMGAAEELDYREFDIGELRFKSEPE